MQKDYYDILGISKNASLQEIKSAYRKKALKWHPDKNKSAEAHQRFKEINQAYEVLSDSEKRKMYDQFGPDVFDRKTPSGASAGGRTYTYRSGPFIYTYSTSGGRSPSGESDFPFEGFDFGGFSDPFEIFEQFFGFTSPMGARQRRPAYQIEISFAEAINGTSKQVSIGGRKKQIKIPAGVDDGMRIRFSDFDLLVSVRPDKKFKREGQDIYVEVPISLTTAILGGTVEMPTIDDKVKLKVRPGTQPNSMLRLRDRGVVYPNSNRRGDQYVIFKVQIPEKLNTKAKILLEQLENELREK